MTVAQKEKESIWARLGEMLGITSKESEPADAATALAAENEQLKRDLAARDTRENTERAARIDAEVSAFMKEHGAKMGAEYRAEFEALYRAAKSGPNAAESLASLERLAKSHPPAGPEERVKAGGARVDAIVARVSGEDEADPNAAHFEALARLDRAGIKQNDPQWQQKYLATLAEVRLEGGAANGAAA